MALLFSLFLLTFVYEFRLVSVEKAKVSVPAPAMDSALDCAGGSGVATLQMVKQPNNITEEAEQSFATFRIQLVAVVVAYVVTTSLH